MSKVLYKIKDVIMSKSFNTYDEGGGGGGGGGVRKVVFIVFIGKNPEVWCLFP